MICLLTDGVGGILLDYAILVQHLELLCRVSASVKHDRLCTTYEGSNQLILRSYC
jgi:hypothetical protein